MKEKSNCIICGEKTKKVTSKTCSRPCLKKWFEKRKDLPEWQEKSRTVQRKCEICNSFFSSPVSRTGAKFCSRGCLSKWKAISYKGRKLTKEWKLNQNLSKKRENIIKYGDYFCNFCDKKFDNNLSLRSHKSYCNTNDEKKDVMCELCKKIFKRERNLETHVILFHDAKRNDEHKEKAKIASQKRLTQKTSREEIEFFDFLKNFSASSYFCSLFAIRPASLKICQ